MQFHQIGTIAVYCIIIHRYFCFVFLLYYYFPFDFIFHLNKKHLNNKFCFCTYKNINNIQIEKKVILFVFFFISNSVDIATVLLCVSSFSFSKNFEYLKRTNKKKIKRRQKVLNLFKEKTKYTKMELRVGNKYKLGRKIGSGSFGDIYLGTTINTGEEVKHIFFSQLHIYLYLLFCLLFIHICFYNYLTLLCELNNVITFSVQQYYPFR